MERCECSNFCLLPVTLLLFVAGLPAGIPAVLKLTKLDFQIALLFLLLQLSLSSDYGYQLTGREEQRERGFV